MNVNPKEEDMNTGREWHDACLEVQRRVQAHPLFMRLVKGYGGRPSGVVPTQRARRLATVICADLGLRSDIYRGNVFGAAAAWIEVH